MNQWIPTKKIFIKKWNSRLFTITLQAKIDTFSSGQFTKLLCINKKKKIQRAYSFVNPPHKKNLEFYILLIPNGKLTPLLINPKNLIYITKKSFGFFTLSEILPCQNLWMFSTGTAIGPYLSMLNDHSNKMEKKFEKIIIVYAVKFLKDLNYYDKLIKCKKKYKKKIIIQIILSQEKNKKFLFGRIPNLIENGILEKTIGINLNKCNSHVMLCGNPNMIKNTEKILKNNKNMTKNLRRKPGNITCEKYW